MKKLSEMKKLIANILILALIGITVPIHARAEEVVATKPYPLNICLITGQTLGGMGEPVSLVYKGQAFKFCCAGCKSAFLQNPDRFLKKLADTVNAERGEAGTN